MLKKITALAGFGAGYVLGAKAGQDRYRQIMTKVDQLRGTPQVQQVTEKVTDTVTTTATDLADKAKGKANDAVASVTGSDTTVDLSDKRPMEGAAPSRTTL